MDKEKIELSELNIRRTLSDLEETVGKYKETTLKNKSKVIIKQPIQYITSLKINKADIQKSLELILANHGPSMFYSRESLLYAIENIYSYFLKYLNNKDNYNSTNTVVTSSVVKAEEIESVINFDDIENEVKKYFYIQFAHLRMQQSMQTKTKKELKEELEKEFKTSLENQQNTINSLEEKHKKEIANIHTSYKTDESKFEEVISAFGYKKVKGIFGRIKLIKK